MIFYHISAIPIKFNADKSYTFKPRIPSSRMSDEDSDTPRICVSTSMEGCMNAMPYSLGHMGPELPNNLGSALYLFIVFKIDTKKLNIHVDSIVNPEVLYHTYNVSDALENDEHWMTKEFRVPEEDIKIMQLSSYEDLAGSRDSIKELLGLEYLDDLGNKSNEEHLIHYNLHEHRFCFINLANVHSEDLQDIRDEVESDIIVNEDLIMIKSKTSDETLDILLKILEK